MSRFELPIENSTSKIIILVPEEASKIDLISAQKYISYLITIAPESTPTGN